MEQEGKDKYTKMDWTMVQFLKEALEGELRSETLTAVLVHFMEAQYKHAIDMQRLKLEVIALRLQNSDLEARLHQMGEDVNDKSTLESGEWVLCRTKRDGDNPNLSNLAFVADLKWKFTKSARMVNILQARVELVQSQRDEAIQ